YKIDYLYDDLNRLRSQWIRQNIGTDINPDLTKNYSYVTDKDNNTSSLVSEVTYSGYSTRSYSYTYDAVGNITSVKLGNNVIASYEYDDLGQLTRENNMSANKTYVYTYDDRGNITSRKTYAYTTGTLGTLQSTDSYGYYQQYDTEMWGDVLKSYNGTTFSYDEIGNPLTYYNGATYSFNWINGRRLTSGTKGSTSFQYQYNTDGLRTRKIVGSTTYDYYWNGSQLAMMTVTNGTNVTTLKFYYDAQGVPFYLDYNGTEYFYITNLQGDVVGIANSNGVVGYYEYDAWGRILTINSASSMEYSALTTNPLRYRGYIYDNETGFYYLQTRYYDPAIRRFINADDVDLLGANGDFSSYNLFVYCGNNPVSRADNSGYFWEAIAIGFVVGLVGQYVSDVIGNIQSGKTGINIFTPTSSALDYFASGVGGAIAAIPGLKLIGTMAVGAIGSVASDGIKGNINSWEDLGKSALKGGIANGIGYGVAKGMAALKVKQISNMPRSSRKVYLRDNFYRNSQAKANVNLRTFANSSMTINIGILEKQIAVFRAGVYSTVTSTLATLF
ncbi:MAG: RHS repeat-associated core domain-containing protein, partial [Ruminococcaceae bacterium]|nr:RHS repeat-associated core domain-containing protein [Oscillospiraceae bacterium]